MIGAYTDMQLEAMMADLESELVERKKSASDRSSIRRNLCAFANDLPRHGRPGVIFIGVEDDGECAGLTITDELLRKLTDMRNDGNIQPLPSLFIDKRTLSNCEVVVMQVAPSDNPPVRYQGRTFVKVGPSVQIATVEEERRLSERNLASHRPFDQMPALETSLEDLDLDYVEARYFPQAIAQDILEQNERPLEQQLQSLRLIRDGKPTWGALLGMGRDPQAWLPGAWVQFLRIDGSYVTDPVLDQKTLSGRIDDVLLRLDDILKSNIRIRTFITESPQETREPDYPFPALQQLVRNAVMHRNYQGSNAPVRVYWFLDRIEIMNPGGLYGDVTRENFGDGTTDYRNPLVAEIMHHLGFTQRFGIGVPLAHREMKGNGNPDLEFDFQPTQVKVIARSAK